MLQVTIPGQEYYDEVNNMFYNKKSVVLNLEHSLISVSKWESKWHKPFLDTPDLSTEQIIDYIKCMTLNKVDDDVYLRMTNENIEEIYDYINNPMTATWFNESLSNKSVSHKIITSEILYYDMIAMNIPFECEKWHLNRLITLIRVCAEKNNPPKKMNRQEMLSRRNQLNEQRKAKYHTNG